MRTRTTILFALLAGACSGNNLNQQGSGDGGGAGQDASMGDLAGSAVDLAGMAQMCDPVKQNCPDPAMPKCALTVTGTGMNRMVVTMCVADGTVARDQMCTVDMNTGLDDCVKGTRCTGRALPMGQTECRKLCSADSECGAGQKCAASLGIGVCIPACTPFGTDCGVGNTCASVQTDVASTMMAPRRFLACRPSGSAPLFAGCQTSNDCGDNAVCLRQSRTCTALCDDSNACGSAPPMDDAGVADGGTPLSCIPQGLPNGGGICN